MKSQVFLNWWDFLIRTKGCPTTHSNALLHYTCMHTQTWEQADLKPLPLNSPFGKSHWSCESFYSTIEWPHLWAHLLFPSIPSMTTRGCTAPPQKNPLCEKREHLTLLSPIFLQKQSHQIPPFMGPLFTFVCIVRQWFSTVLLWFSTKI